MAKLALIYGMRLLPLDDLVKSRRQPSSSKRQVRAYHHAPDRRQQGRNRVYLSQSIEAFFEMYPEI
jgi:hypothetical protein